ncbi:dimethyl sulfoxide reductase anchor subunit family protein [Thiothrix eikelboomii]|uniref:DMSO reductase anchor subunit n=1 Tax=Thiothrix eikelboomii TaxID=92487 RepID=A0A1T4X6G6_9GAMM|nr:DmsC/YnfH family molybdoenzyme membrane anchor subunit [Thiothrix eikelboomii]SKA85192.1 DMSO reductase anchor subunit [Thiothrix eikelboomii]
MHPAFSVIFFTVASGAGYGLFILMALGYILGFVEFDKGVTLVGGLLSLALISAGLLSSTLHLANPKNAWRAFFRFRTSWLAREGVFAVLFYPVALLFLLGLWVNLEAGVYNGFVAFIGVAASLLALATLFSTGMIYGCLKTIRQWNTALTPTNYLLLGLATGGVLFVLVLAWNGKPTLVMASLSLALLTIAAISKAIYYFWVRTVIGPTINTATGFTRAQVRLLDTGHTAGTFLTDEFAYFAPAKLLLALRITVFVAGFFIPLMLLGFMVLGAQASGLAFLAMLSSFIGIGAERWLFFAEARHVIRLYHGAQHT